MAQVDTVKSRTYIAQMDSAFAPLLNDTVPYDRLYDRVFPWANLTNISSGDTVTYSSFKQAWYEMELSELPTVTPTTASTYETLRDTAYLSSLKNVVEVASIATKMSRIDTLAISDGRLDSTEMGWAHVPGQPSPYDAYSVSMNSISVEEFTEGMSYTFRLKPQHILNTHRNALYSIQLTESNNGINVTLLPGQEVVVSMIDTGTFYLTLTANFVGASSYINKQKITVKPQAEIRTDCERTQILVESDIPYKGSDEDIGTTSLADAYIYYHKDENGQCDQTIKKPIIICDGYDPLDARKIRMIENLFRYNDDMNYSIDELRKEGFDVIILNFPVIGDGETAFRSGVRDDNGTLVDRDGRDGGSDYTQRNAFLMVKLIQMINDSLEYYNSDEELCIIGPSMGGQVTRYALAYMENEDANGVPDMDHNTRVWISYDSPHHGANISIANMGIIASLGYAFNKAEAREQFDFQINTRAGGQYLINQVRPSVLYDPLPLFYNTFYQNSTADERELYLQDLHSNGLPNSDGWPQNVKRVAIVNGSDKGVTNGNAGDEAFYIKAQAHYWDIFWVHAAEIQSFLQDDYLVNNDPLYKIDFAKNEDSPVTGVTARLVNKNPQGSLDVIPGSKHNSSEQVFDGLIEAIDENSEYPIRFVERRLKPKHTFIPVISALAFKDTDVDWWQRLDNRNLVCSDEIPFHAYFMSGKNDDHITVTEDIYEFIKYQCLDGKLGCKPICHTFNPSGPQYICGGNPNTIHTYSYSGIMDIGETLEWVVSGDLSLIEINNQSIGVKISSSSGYGEVKAILRNDCGDRLEKVIKVTIGIPDLELSSTFDKDLCLFTVVQNSVPSKAIPNQYQWSYDGSNYFVGGKTFEIDIFPLQEEDIYAKSIYSCGESTDVITLKFPDDAGGCDEAIIQRDISNNEVLQKAAIEENITTNEKFSNDFKGWIYPNPTLITWTIKIPEGVDDVYSVMLTDLQGRKIQKVINFKSKNKLTIGNSSLLKGVYFVNIGTKDNIIKLKAIKF